MKISQVDRYNTINSQKNINKKGVLNSQKSFKGAGDVAFNVLDKAFSVLDKNAMIQVSFVDTVSTNIPRTLVDLKTGLAAAFETCRREFSGLFVNCLMPGLVVKGLAEILPKSKELKGTEVAASWASGNAIDKLKGVYKEAQTSGAIDTTREYVTKAIGSLEGLDGTNWVKYADKAGEADYQSAISDITTAIGKSGKERKNLLKNAQKKLVGLTKAESVLKFNGTPQSNLEETIRDITDLGSKFNIVKDKTISNLVPDAKEVNSKVVEAIDNYGASLTKFVNKKSLIGMALVIGIAVSVQTINRKTV